MKNNIVQFTRPITFIFCHEEVKCWIRSFDYEYDLISIKIGGKKIVCALEKKKWSLVIAQKLAEDIILGLQVYQRMGYMHLNYPDDL